MFTMWHTVARTDCLLKSEFLDVCLSAKLHLNQAWPTSTSELVSCEPEGGFTWQTSKMLGLALPFFPHVWPGEPVWVVQKIRSRFEWHQMISCAWDRLSSNEFVCVCVIEREGERERWCSSVHMCTMSLFAVSLSPWLVGRPWPKWSHLLVTFQSTSQ